MVSVTLHL